MMTRNEMKDYYRGVHGEIRRKEAKIHLTKKQRRKVNKLVREYHGDKKEQVRAENGKTNN